MTKYSEDDIPEEFIATKDLEGKKIVDDEGKIVGKVQAIHIDPLNFSIRGISIKGSFRGSNFIDSSYIGELSEDGITLLSAPIQQQYLDELYE